MAQPSVHGRFIWQELITADLDAAATFYSRLIGWQVQASAAAEANYSVLAADTGPVGGLLPLSEDARQMGARPHWLPYIGAEDVDKTLAAAERLGARVLRPAADIESVGRYAVLADPQGAAFGLYCPLHPVLPPTKRQPQRGEFSWQELATTDYEAAFRFYGGLFGWQALQRMDKGPAGTYLIFGRDGVQQGGIYKLSVQMPAPYWLGYIAIENIDAVVQRARETGGRIITGPMEVPGGGRIAQLLDPGSALFALHSAPKVAAGAARAPARSPRGAGHAPAIRASGEPAPSSRAGAPAASRSTAPEAPATSPAPAASKPAAPGSAATERPAPPAKRAARKSAKGATRKAAKRAAKKAAKKAAKRNSARKGTAGKRAAGKRGASKRARGSAAGRSVKRSARRGGRSGGVRRSSARSRRRR